MDQKIQSDLYLLQEALNTVLESGADEVRRRDITVWFDFDAADPGFEAIEAWGRAGYLEIIQDARGCKDRDVCARILHKITEIDPPPVSK